MLAHDQDENRGDQFQGLGDGGHVAKRHEELVEHILQGETAGAPLVELGMEASEGSM